MRTTIILFFGLLLGIIVSIWLPIPRAADLAVRNEVVALRDQIDQGISLIPDKINYGLNQLFPLKVQTLGEELILTRTELPEAMQEFLGSSIPALINKTPRAKEVARLRTSLSNEINNLSALDRQALSDQISEINWSLNALDFLSLESADDELLVELVLGQSLIDSQLNGIQESLIEKVVQRHAGNVTTAENQIESALANGESLDESSLGAALLLADYMSDTGFINAAERIAQLESLLRSASWLKQYETLSRDSFESEEEYEIAQYLLVEESASIIESSVSSRTNLQTDFVSKVKAFSNLVSDSQRQKSEARNAKYQKWALQLIEESKNEIGENASIRIGEWLTEAKDFPSNGSFILLKRIDTGKYPKFNKALLGAAYENQRKPSRILKSTMPEIIEGVSKMTPGWKDQAKMAQALTADSLFHLMVINEAYLDRPVAALYSQAFQKAWIYLEGTELRLSVAKESIGVSKKVPGDDLSTQ